MRKFLHLARHDKGLESDSSVELCPRPYLCFNLPWATGGTAILQKRCYRCCSTPLLMSFDQGSNFEAPNHECGCAFSEDQIIEGVRDWCFLSMENPALGKIKDGASALRWRWCGLYLLECRPRPPPPQKVVGDNLSYSIPPHWS